MATNADFNKIARVSAHEYFHNWSGDRVTCRAWFQLSLKEGLTVFRDQSFSADIGREALVAEYGQAFLEAQLEPGAAGDAVARPIVEIFVRGDTRDLVEVGIGCHCVVGPQIGRLVDADAS